MKYQVIISERPRQSESVTRNIPKRVRLKTHLSIGDAAFWQHRIQEFMDDLGLDEHATVMVAK